MNTIYFHCYGVNNTKYAGETVDLVPF